VYNDHPLDSKILSAIDKWTLFIVPLCNKSPVGDQKMLVVTDRWSSFPDVLTKITITIVT